jgi:HD-GYP domain-containing protein (c-di-GMP phosphodiesterase class II)
MPQARDDGLAVAQQTLARALGRARAGEDRELLQKVREGGEALAHLLGGLLKMSHLHASDNRAFDAPVAEVTRLVASLLELLGTVHVATVEDQVYVNEVRVRTDGNGGGKDLGAELARHGAGGVSFHAALAESEVRALVAAFSQKAAAQAPRRAAQQALVERGVRSVELAPRYRYRMEAEGASQQDASEALRQTVRLVEETFDHLAAGRILNPLPLRRAVVGLLQLGPATPDLWEPPSGGAPHAQHAASVTLLALLVGKAARLRASVLQDLGLAALVHDAGYAALPSETAAGPEGLARHPGEGARLLLRQRGFHEAKLLRLRAVLDHHREHVEPRGRPSILGEILRLAEDYTTLLRVYAGRVSPADALGAMLRAGGRIYHPVLAQLMVNALGKFPPGTLLELEDGRYARVVSPVRSPETFATPLVRLYDARTRALSPERHDLANGPAVRRALAG